MLWHKSRASAPWRMGRRRAVWHIWGPGAHSEIIIHLFINYWILPNKQKHAWCKTFLLLHASLGNAPRASQSLQHWGLHNWWSLSFNNLFWCSKMIAVRQQKLGFGLSAYCSNRKMQPWFVANKWSEHQQPLTRQHCEPQRGQRKIRIIRISTTGFQ